MEESALNFRKWTYITGVGFSALYNANLLQPEFGPSAICSPLLQHVSLFGSHLGHGLALYFSPHIASLPAIKRVIYSAVGSVMLNFSSGALIVVIRMISHGAASSNRTLSFLFGGVALSLLNFAAYYYVNDMDLLASYQQRVPHDCHGSAKNAVSQAPHKDPSTEVNSSAENKLNESKSKLSESEELDLDPRCRSDARETRGSDSQLDKLVRQFARTHSTGTDSPSIEGGPKAAGGDNFLAVTGSSSAIAAAAAEVDLSSPSPQLAAAMADITGDLNNDFSEKVNTDAINIDSMESRYSVLNLSTDDNCKDSSVSSTVDLGRGTSASEEKGVDPGTNESDA